jgi:CRISPR-associated protein Cmr4
MATLKKSLYRLRALTNVHVGSSDNTYGLVDKLVQRDPINGFPIIHGSSLKGAFKDYAEQFHGTFDEQTSEWQLKPEWVPTFGNEDQDGKDKFFSAHLLTLPVRALNKPWYNATCPALLYDLISQLKGFGFEKTPLDDLKDPCSKLAQDWSVDFIHFDKIKEAKVDIEECKNGEKYSEELDNKKLQPWIGDLEKLVILRDEIFMDFTDNLPVVARNRLDKERNLWYEEFVPRESVFVFLHFSTHTTDSDGKTVMDHIAESVTKGNPMQIGANASVDYGYCELKRLISIKQ